MLACSRTNDLLAIWSQTTVNSRSGVLEDVLGIEDTFWSHGLSLEASSSRKFFCSRPRTALFLIPQNLVRKRQKPCGNFVKTFFIWRRLKKIFEDLFVFFFGEHLSLVSFFLGFGLEHFCLCPLVKVCPRKSVLGLGLGFFAFLVLALAASLVSSTPPLVNSSWTPSWTVVTSMRSKINFVKKIPRNGLELGRLIIFLLNLYARNYLSGWGPSVW